MKCQFCLATINAYKMDWCYLFDGQGVAFAHLSCIRYEEEMERVETEEYLLEKVGKSWS